MSKKLFVLLVVLMSLSLIGIISIQAYYINNSVENEKKQFNFNVRKALSFVSQRIEDREYRELKAKLDKLIDQGVVVDSTAFRDFYFKSDDVNSNETLLYRNSVLEENYKLSSSLFDIGLDSVTIKRVLNSSQSKVVSKNTIETEGETDLDAMLLSIGKITRGEQVFYDDLYETVSVKTPIHKRVKADEIQRLLDFKLVEDGINIPYEFAIYSNDLATKVQSENFELEKNKTYKIPIFENENSKSKFKLLVNFPEGNKFILSNVVGMILLSIIFTSIIIIAYSSALFQLIKQRQISEIKTDFINNMTHEFKTPIATINLALDAIRNPKIINDQEKVMRYLGMIKEENKRMHAQVENVLRISKLEKNELNISKERVDLHDLVEDAISHIELIVEDKNGKLTSNLKAEASSVLANETHFTNVIVNMLDNAVKYSPEAPKIEVSTEQVGNNILLKIKDNGSGMSKAAQKKVFEKFYREHTGNIHNVKGHGLGLAYVKRIVDDHQGHVSVESEKDKGSTFTIKLPLIS
ncbi:sensor histidine kinase [Lacinutrix salivirga]